MDVTRLPNTPLDRMCDALSRDCRARPYLDGLERKWREEYGPTGAREQRRALLEESIAEAQGSLDRARGILRKAARSVYSSLVTQQEIEVPLEDAEASDPAFGDRDVARSEIEWGGDSARRSGKHEFLRGALQEAISVGPFAARLAPDETEGGRRRERAWRGLPETAEQCRDAGTIKRMLPLKAASCAGYDGTAEAPRQYALWSETYLGHSHTPTQQTIRNWCREFGYTPARVRDGAVIGSKPEPLIDEL
jgi:hypothetical protein